MKKLFQYVSEYKKLVALCVLMTLGEVVCELSLPLLMSKIVDVGVESRDLGYIARMGAIMVGLAVLALGFGVANARFSAKASQGSAANLREALFDKIRLFSFSNIDRFSSGSLITRLTSDVTQLQLSMMMSLRLLTRAPIMLVSAFVIAVSINAQMSLLILAAVFLLALVTTFIVSKAGPMFALLQKRMDAVNGVVQENLVGIRVVKAFVREDHEKSKFKKVNDDVMNTSLKTGKITAFLMPAMTLIMSFTTISVVWFGGNLVGVGTLGTGELMSFLTYIMQILMSVMMFSMILVMLSRAKACAERAVEVLETQPDIEDPAPADSQAHRVSRGKVEFRGVSFRYTGDTEEKNVLTNISFTAQPGELVGIIGGTGSGKTSLVSLIPRFYDASGGEVLVDDVDVRAYRQEDLRDGIGMVMQKNNLFSGTIKENLLWGNEDATMEEIAQAARDAQAHGFIESFPKGYDTALGQGGVNVSGGQKQRLCIARAMMKKPPILILDDSTSAVDTATEAKIRQCFYENFKDTTVIIVAQRITSVQHADKILVLDDGAIAGMGTHDELMASNEVYREIYHSQTQGGAA